MSRRGFLRAIGWTTATVVLGVPMPKLWTPRLVEVHETWTFSLVKVFYDDGIILTESRNGCSYTLPIE